MPVGAGVSRELVNGDKDGKPGWAGGKKTGTLVAVYGKRFSAC